MLQHLPPSYRHRGLRHLYFLVKPLILRLKWCTTSQLSFLSISEGMRAKTRHNLQTWIDANSFLQVCVTYPCIYVFLFTFLPCLGFPVATQFPAFEACLSRYSIDQILKPVIAFHVVFVRLQHHRNLSVAASV